MGRAENKFGDLLVLLNVASYAGMVYLTWKRMEGV